MSTKFVDAKIYILSRYVQDGKHLQNIFYKSKKVRNGKYRKTKKFSKGIERETGKGKEFLTKSPITATQKSQKSRILSQTAKFFLAKIANISRIKDVANE